MNECPNCGHAQSPNVEFCTFCGKSIPQQRREPASEEPRRDIAFLKVLGGSFLGIFFGILAFLSLSVAAWFLSSFSAFVLKPFGISDTYVFGGGLGTRAHGLGEALFSLGLCVLGYTLIRQGRFARIKPFMQVALSIAFVIAFGGLSICSALTFVFAGSTAK